MLSISLRRRFGRPRFKYILEGNLARFRARFEGVITLRIKQYLHTQITHVLHSH